MDPVGGRLTVIALAALLLALPAVAGASDALFEDPSREAERTRAVRQLAGERPEGGNCGHSCAAADRWC